MNIFAAALFAGLVLVGYPAAFEGDTGRHLKTSRPAMPPIEDRARWEIEQVPATLTVVWPNGLQMAFPVMSSTHFTYDEAFKNKGGLWYFRASCTSFVRIVRPHAIVFRWGDEADWQPWTKKTFSN